jgi:hypothetical protein
MRAFLLIMAALCMAEVVAVPASEHPCAAKAAIRAKQLFLFHTEPEVPDSTHFTFGPPIMLPRARRERNVEVLEVNAHVDPRGTYTMTLNYLVVERQCYLIGEQIKQGK